MPGWMKDPEDVPSNTLNIGIPVGPDAPHDGSAAGRAKGKGQGRGARTGRGTPGSASGQTHLSRAAKLIRSLGK